MNKLSDFYFKPEKEVIAGREIPCILGKFDPNYPSVVDRFFTKYYYICDNNADKVQTVLFHSNRICLVGLDESHMAIKKGIQSINFDIGNCDRSKNKVSGKGKKGAMNLQPTSTLAIITCDDGTQHKIISCITGKLVEVNDRLLTNPKLIGQDGVGYVAVILPKIEKCDQIKTQLLTEEQYNLKLLDMIADWSADNVVLLFWMRELIQLLRICFFFLDIIETVSIHKIQPQLYFSFYCNDDLIIILLGRLLA